ncbi:MAG: NADH-dependent [FeFe] hydrogenase, group A6 [Spirochaetaceae bacterium]
MIHLTVDGIGTAVPEGATVLEAAQAAGVEIPTLCRHEDLEPTGACGMCVVEMNTQGTLKRACVTPAREGMEVRTNTAALRRMRRTLLELVLAAHPKDCLQCIKHGGCELQELAERLEVRELSYDTYTRGLPVDRSSPGIVRDMNKCIGCGRCVEVCNEVQSVGSIFFRGRGSDTIVAPPEGFGMGESACVNCGQCVVYCPVGALYEREYIEEVWSAIEDPEQTVVAQIAPAVRVALGEEFGMAPGTLSIGKIYAVLRRLGVNKVLDTNFSADLTIMEEGTEFLERLHGGGALPLITSCSPGWIKFGETFFPELMENVSSCKSPQQMLGALIKSYYAESRGLNPEKITSLSIMPCTAKKYEASRPEMSASGYRDVDYVLTTRELARMIKEAGIDFAEIGEEAPDPMMSSYTGAATIFGATGGVMEAAVRTAYELETGKPLESLDLQAVRGLDGVKEATLDVNGTPVRVAVAHGLANARGILERVRAEAAEGRRSYEFIEIMACTGGCVGGGGQPIPNTLSQRRSRAQGLYREDTGLEKRKSHENPEVQSLYEKFLGKPGGERAHHLLHTEYVQRRPYTEKFQTVKS